MSGEKSQELDANQSSEPEESPVDGPADEDERPGPEAAADDERQGDPSDAELVGAAEEELQTSTDEELEALTAELEEMRDRHLRLAAEFDNFRKRTIREKAQYAERAQAELVKELLEPLDDLARVSELGSGSDEVEAVLEGVSLVERKLRQVLESKGLSEIRAEGERFDPNLHEALTTAPTDDPDEDDVIVQELGKGYLFKETLLRPALVEVQKYRPSEESGEPAEDDA